MADPLWVKHGVYSVRVCTLGKIAFFLKNSMKKKHIDFVVSHKSQFRWKALSHREGTFWWSCPKNNSMVDNWVIDEVLGISLSRLTLGCKWRNTRFKNTGVHGFYFFYLFFFIKWIKKNLNRAPLLFRRWN